MMPTVTPLETASHADPTPPHSAGAPPEGARTEHPHASTPSAKAGRLTGSQSSADTSKIGDATTTLDAAQESAAIARVLAGDSDAYDVIVRSYMRRAFAVAYRILGHQQDAEDVVQDAFFTALERIDTFDTTRRFGPWFLRIVANHAHNQRASKSVRERGTGVDLDVVPGRSAPDRDAEGSDVMRAFHGAVARLAPRPRLIVQLVDVDGFTPAEAAEMLHLSPGTVRGYLFEARQVLRRALRMFVDVKETEHE